MSLPDGQHYTLEIRRRELLFPTNDFKNKGVTDANRKN